MTLKTYKQKRNFKKTPEPKGLTGKVKKSKNLYIIQKHAASHLHYDFRLELNGVLVSWAVPKGPSLDPSVKRLAVHVEDHPIAYGAFEGIIPKGQYGGGTVMLWDKGEWFCDNDNPLQAYKKGDLTFTLKAKKLQGKWKLVRINKDDKTWLLMKVKDHYAKPAKEYDITLAQPKSVLTKQSMDQITQHYTKVWGKKGLIDHSPQQKIKFALPASPFPKIIYPQLATLVDQPPKGEAWLHEIKFDGYRMLAFKQGKQVHIFTRQHNDWTRKFKDVAQAVSELPIENIILDGEIVVLDDKQHSDFQLMQNALKEKNAKFIYYIFDLIYFDKFNLTALPLLERKQHLKKFLATQDDAILRYSDHVFAPGQEVLTKACELGLEGIVSKNKDSFYSQVRDHNWLKTKCIKRQEFVIGGFNPSTRRNYFRSLMLGVFNKKQELVYAGNVGTGFTASSLKSIYSLLSKHLTQTMPFSKRPPASKNSVWVKPVLIAEIEFTEWTDAGTLRHPSFKGIRSDKSATKISKEVAMPVEGILQETNNKNQYKLTHPNKLLYPESKITKKDVADYYAGIQKWILPYIVNRPLTLVRCPEGYENCFYQKHFNEQALEGMYDITIKEKKGSDDYIYIKDEQGLMAFPQLGVLEIHPWGSRIENVECPDLIIFDLDPGPSLPWKKIVGAAFEIKKILEEMHLKSFVKTTGGKGLHVVIPIKPEYDWQEVKTFAHVLVDYLVQTHPLDYVNKMTKSKRNNKIFVDYLRNQRGATAVAPYSTRARAHAPIATPLAWDELTNDRRDTFFTLKTLPKRLATLRKDPWVNFFKVKQTLNLAKFKG